jgi:hypothetical protein
VARSRASDEERAREVSYQYDDKDFSMTDAISFAVMERLRITQALTFDRHFAQYGFTVLTPGLLQPAARLNLALRRRQSVHSDRLESPDRLVEDIGIHAELESALERWIAL